MIDLVATASAALGFPLTEPVRLTGSGRSVVLRCKSAARGTVVVKAYPATPDGTDSFIAETAGLEFTAGLGMAPDVLAADSRHRLIVMSDLGDGPSLADVLLRRSPPDPAGAVLSWARTCGELARRTAGRREEFARLLAVRAGDTSGRGTRRGRGAVGSLGVDAPDARQDPVLASTGAAALSRLSGDRRSCCQKAPIPFGLPSPVGAS